MQFVGFIPSEDLAIWYNCAEVFIYPSVFEGFGLPVLEAMACGTPVIVSDASSLPEVAGEAGHLHRAAAMSLHGRRRCAGRGMMKIGAERQRERGMGRSGALYLVADRAGRQLQAIVKAMR